MFKPGDTVIHHLDDYEPLDQANPALHFKVVAVTGDTFTATCADGMYDPAARCRVYKNRYFR